ncbi:hypothetical protein L7F22_010804, partial [Adiantum nelumboides]|nr:hypothetical protein [Adiantum nelumboides]
LFLDKSKMICIGTDGASAMVGLLNGVTTRFKRENPFMTSINCIAHRASLCLVDAVRHSPYAQTIDQFVNEIASTFSKSSIRSAELVELESEFGCAVLQMSRIHKVHWLSRSLCVHKVCESLEPLLVFLKEHNSSLFDKVKDFQFVYSLHFMSDIFQRLSILSKIFQSTFVDITIVVGLIEVEIRLITTQFIDMPIVDVNAFLFDGLDYPIIPDYGPHHGQLAALRASMRGNMYRSIEVERKKSGKDIDDAI